MEEKYLMDICNPKQWKTIPKNELIEDGEFPVYGANGIIGRYNKYNHEKPTVLITCRGATCGNIHITVPQSYINGNAMSLDDLNESKCKKEYLYYFLKYYDLSKIISGTAQPQITINGLKKVKVKLYSIEKQEKIVDELNKINKVISLKKSQLEELSSFIKSQFVEMFDLEKYKSEELGKICDVRDGTHDSPKYIEKSDYKLITSKNINKEGIDFSDVKYITKKDYDKINIRSNVSYGDILMPMIGTIGNPVIVKVQEEKIDFTIKNLALIKFFIKTVVINKYIKYLVDSEWFEKEVLKNSRGGTQKFLSLKDIRKMKIPLSPIDLQNQFSEIVKQIDKQKFEIEKSLKETQELYESLMEEYFKGERR